MKNKKTVVAITLSIGVLAFFCVMLYRKVTSETAGNPASSERDQVTAGILPIKKNGRVKKLAEKLSIPSTGRSQ